jgi:transcriptional regulator of acetoin/glycerol metabolism
MGLRPASETQRATDESSDASAHETAHAQIFVVLDRARPLAGGSRHSLGNIDHVTLGRGETRVASRIVEDDRRTLQLQLPDRRMSAAHARLERRASGWTIQDRQSTNGVYVNGRQIDEATLADGDILELGHTLFRFRQALAAPFNAPGDVDSSRLQGLPACFGTLGPRLTHDLENLGRVARSEVSVLLEGETGTGKEVLARAIHAESRREGAFVAVNCGALPQALVESLLFGHKKGAFSGAAADALGFVRAAERGTLFLDEVGDLPAASQAVLLRVLQEREVVPLGAARPLPVDVRVIAATHRPLAPMAASAVFRRDLLARLAQFTHALPPLRDRIEDVGVLVAAILPKVAGTRAPALSLSATAARALVTHRWPTNVRELEHCLKVSVVLAAGDRLELAPGASERAGESAGRSSSGGAAGLWQRHLSPADAAIYEELVARMTEHRGNVTQVAERMGKARRQVQRWISRFRIDVNQFRI